MESAKAAVSKFLGKAGHHDTTVEETVQPAVTSETVKPTQHENIAQAVDREVPSRSLSCYSAAFAATGGAPRKTYISADACGGASVQPWRR